MQQQEEERMKEALKHPDWPTYSNEVERPSEQGRSRRDKGKKDKAQAPKFQMPKVEVPKIDVKSKLTSLNESIKNTKMPTANEIKVKVHRSFHQPLAVRTRVESTDMQQAREMLTKHRTPAELSHLNHPLDIPLPKIRMPSKSKRDISEDETKSLDPGLLVPAVPHFAEVLAATEFSDKQPSDDEQRRAGAEERAGQDQNALPVGPVLLYHRLPNPV
jgi:hypothetical protein